MEKTKRSSSGDPPALELNKIAMSFIAPKISMLKTADQFDSWCDEIDVLINQLQKLKYTCTPQYIVNVMLAHMDAQVKTIIAELVLQDEAVTDVEVKEFLRCNWGIKSSIRDLVKLRQETSVITYNSLFDRTLNRLKYKPDPEEIIKIYIAGLKNEIKMGVQINNPPDLKDIQKNAILRGKFFETQSPIIQKPIVAAIEEKAEEGEDEVEHIVNTYSRMSFKKKVITCHNCGHINHKAENCTELPVNNQDGKNRGKRRGRGRGRRGASNSYNSYQPKKSISHISSEIVLNNSNLNKKEQVKVTADVSKEDNVINTNCNGACSIANSDAHIECTPMIIKVKVAGIDFDVSCCDTGAGVSVISYNSFKRIKDESGVTMYEGKKKGLKAANGSMIKVMGFAMIPVTIGPKSVNIRFQIVEECTFEVIVGMSAIKAFDMIINIKEGYIQVGNERVRFFTSVARESVQVFCPITTKIKSKQQVVMKGYLKGNWKKYTSIQAIIGEHISARLGKGIHIGRSVVKGANQIWVQITNFSNEDKKIRKGQLLAD